MKNIRLTENQAKSLIKLLDRGLAYTDMFYKSYKRLNDIYKYVIDQLTTK